METNTPTEPSKTAPTPDQQNEVQPKAAVPSEAKAASPLSGGKGLIVAVILVIAAIVVGVSVIFGMNATKQYQGMIKKIEQETQELQEDQNDISGFTLNGGSDDEIEDSKVSR